MDDLLSGPPLVPPSRRSHRSDAASSLVDSVGGGGGSRGGGGHRESSRPGSRGGGVSGGEPPLPPPRGRFSSAAPLPSLSGPSAYTFGRGIGPGHGPPEGPVYGRPLHHDTRRHGEAGASPGTAAPYSEMGPPPQALLPPPPPPPPPPGSAHRPYTSPLLRGLGGPQAQGAHLPSHMSLSHREGGGMERALGSSPYGAVHPSMADGYGNGMPRPLLPPLSSVPSRGVVFGETPLQAPPSGAGPHGWGGGGSHGGHASHSSRAPAYYGRPDGQPPGPAQVPLPPPPPPHPPLPPPPPPHSSASAYRSDGGRPRVVHPPAQDVYYRGGSGGVGVEPMEYSSGPVDGGYHGSAAADEEEPRDGPSAYERRPRGYRNSSARPDEYRPAHSARRRQSDSEGGSALAGSALQGSRRHESDEDDERSRRRRPSESDLEDKGVGRGRGGSGGGGGGGSSGVTLAGGPSRLKMSKRQNHWDNYGDEWDEGRVDRDGRDSRDNRDSRDVRYSRDGRTALGDQGPEGYGGRELRGSEVRDLGDAHDLHDMLDLRAVRDVRDSRDRHRSRDGRGSRDNRDWRDVGRDAGRDGRHLREMPVACAELDVESAPPPVYEETKPLVRRRSASDLDGGRDGPKKKSRSARVTPQAVPWAEDPKPRIARLAYATHQEPNQLQGVVREPEELPAVMSPSHAAAHDTRGRQAGGWGDRRRKQQPPVPSSKRQRWVSSTEEDEPEQPAAEETHSDEVGASKPPPGFTSVKDLVPASVPEALAPKIPTRRYASRSSDSEEDSSGTSGSPGRHRSRGRGRRRARNRGGLPLVEEEEDPARIPPRDGAIPPASDEFDAAPAPPERRPGRGLLWAAPILHAGALQLARLVPSLADRALPASWVAEDDPKDDRCITVRGVRLAIPLAYELDPTCRAMDRALDRAENKFRSSRKEKAVGGERGSVVLRRRPPMKKSRHSMGSPSQPRGSGASPLYGSVGRAAGLPPIPPPGKRLVLRPGPMGAAAASASRPLSGAAARSVAKKAAQLAAKAATVPDSDPRDVTGRSMPPGGSSSSLVPVGPGGSWAMVGPHVPAAIAVDASVAPLPPPEEEVKEWKKDRGGWRTFVKTEVVKAVRAHGQVTTTLQKLARGVSGACAREARKRSLRSVRAADDANRRSRRLLKDVLTYWRREERERVEERRRLAAETEAQRSREDELREEQRQKNKLRFLLGQSEAFSSFLQAKAQATSAAAAADTAGSTAASGKGAVDATMDSITGAEDDAELRRKSEAAAAELLVAHRAKLAVFDNETVRQRSISDTAAADRAADEARHADEEGGLGTPSAVDAMDGVTLAAGDDAAAGMSAAAAEAAAAEAAAVATSLAGSDNKQVAAVKQPSILLGKMKGYQLRGLSWLVSLYDQGINGILADEMGLGKTVQTISFLAYLAEAENNWGPFLVVTPKATLHNWQQEVGKFCPSLRVLPYWGSKADRQELRKHWSQKRMYRRDSEFHVCVTSYETLMTDQTHFPRVKWQHVVLDEAQAIKNSASARWKALLNFPCRNRLLLTGTPLQNKMSELWSLLHFIMPTVFDSHTEFADWFAKDIEGHAKNASSMLDSTTLARLRTLLDPFMLRRVKRDVENEMPPKTELVVHCDLTPRQRKLYAGIKANISVEELRRTLGVTSGGGGGGGAAADASEKGQLMNIIMQLRKVCNHPETFQRRTPTAPLQFQRVPPPSIAPLPPAVLTNKSDGPPPPQAVTFVRESALSLPIPSLVRDCLYFAKAERRKACVVTCGPLTPHRLAAQWSPPLKAGDRATPLAGGSLSVLRLAGGLSPSEVFAIAGVLAPVYGWHRITAGVVESLDRLRTVYGLPAESETTDTVKNPLDVPHRRLLLPSFGKPVAGSGALGRILLPGHESPAQMVEVHTRLLRVTRIHVPAATAPSVQLSIPGDASHASALNVALALAYPGPPLDSGVSVAENHALWRGLSGNYGGAVGISSITMPDRGRLVADSGKMQVLDALLRRLKREGHKVLVYSQFTKVMDILENYVQTTGFKYVRLDGQSALADRRDMVAEWQTDDELFVFLLSTRAGGVGINLTAADTVIFFDSDWNPTVDSQAMDRAHRLGQERPVTVYRLLARGTIEERIRSRALQKERINDLVIKGGQIASEAEQADGDATNLRDLAALLMGEDDIDDKAQQLAGVSASITTVATTPGSASVPVAASA